MESQDEWGKEGTFRCSKNHPRTNSIPMRTLGTATTDIGGKYEFCT